MLGSPALYLLLGFLVIAAFSGLSRAPSQGGDLSANAALDDKTTWSAEVLGQQMAQYWLAARRFCLANACPGGALTNQQVQGFLPAGYTTGPWSASVANGILSVFPQNSPVPANLSPSVAWAAANMLNTYNPIWPHRTIAGAVSHDGTAITVVNLVQFGSGPGAATTIPNSAAAPANVPYLQGTIFP